MRKHKNNQGFTLVELLVVISIIVLMASMSAPAIMDFMQQRNLNGSAQIIQGILIRAKSTAASRREQVHVVIFAQDTGTDFTFQKSDGTTLTFNLSRSRGSIYTFILDEDNNSLFQIGQHESLPRNANFVQPAVNTRYIALPDGRVLLENDKANDPETNDDTDIIVNQPGLNLRCFIDIVPNTGRALFSVRPPN